MSKSQNNPDQGDPALNQNNRISEDPADGSRTSDVLGRDGAPTAAEKPPAQDAQDESAIEAFGREGAGVAAKE